MLQKDKFCSFGEEVVQISKKVRNLKIHLTEHAVSKIAS